MNTPVSLSSLLGGLRIGEGWDTHILVEGRPLILGGVTVPHERGLYGHSDADVLLHAITCLLYTSPSPRDLSTSRMPSSA